MFISCLLLNGVSKINILQTLRSTNQFDWLSNCAASSINGQLLSQVCCIICSACHSKVLLFISNWLECPWIVLKSTYWLIWHCEIGIEIISGSGLAMYICSVETLSESGPPMYICPSELGESGPSMYICSVDTQRGPSMYICSLNTQGGVLLCIYVLQRLSESGPICWVTAPLRWLSIL